MGALNQALELAYKTSRSTSWDAQPIYDHSDQRFHRDTIKAQLKDYIISSNPRTTLMFTEWALTGKWSQFQKQPVYFVREILIWSMEQNYENRYPDFPDAPPPWKSKYIAQFLEATVYGWLRFGAKEWLNLKTDEFYGLQESMFESYYPHE
jgi:hypothetical protein